MEQLQPILQVVEKFSDRPFLIDSNSGCVLNFGEFHQLAGHLATRLHHTGIRRGDRIAILLNHSTEFVILYFACLYLGAVAVPINPQLHKREMEFILNHAGATLVIYSPATHSLIVNISAREKTFGYFCLFSKTESWERESPEHSAWSIDENPTENPDDWQPLAGVAPEDLFTITFTSGTTGLPKGVPHRIDSLLQSAMAFNKALRFTPNHRFYHVFAMAYMAGFLNTLLCPFLAGASVVLSRTFDARLALNFWEAPIKYQVNTLWLVPTILSSLLQIDRDQNGITYCREQIKTVCVGTAPLSLKLKQDFEEKYGVALLESYGLSETLFVATNTQSLEYHPGSVGQTLAGVGLKIVNESGAEVKPGDTGEIWIQTPFLMAGYLNYQTLQPEALAWNEWFPSGDVGYLSSEGYLFITGRKKDLIIRGGLNLSPRAIEEVLMVHESIVEVAVVGIPHDFYGEEVVAVVKLKPGYTLGEVQPQLDKLCKENLSVISIPTQFFELAQFPTSTTGKIQKAKLREWLVGQATKFKEET